MPILEETLETLPFSLDIVQSRKRIFTQKGVTLLIGGVPMPENVRAILRDQAKYLQTSQLWEVLEASIVNESAELALIQSQNWEHVLSAKQLYHWQHFFKNMIYVLAKD